MRPRTPLAVRVNVAAVSCLSVTSSMVPRTPLALRLNTAAASYLKPATRCWFAASVNEQWKLTHAKCSGGAGYRVSPAVQPVAKAAVKL